MEKQSSKLVRALENLVLVVILLVLVQTFLEDYSIVAGFSPTLIKAIKLAALFFDLFFTIEFFIRLFNAAGKGRAKNYFVQKNGWIDLIASVPLLLLVSGPYFVQTVFQINFNIGNEAFFLIGLIKLIKAIRVTRILRLLRVLKIFGKIKNVESVMAQRHISVISTIVVLTIILFMFVTATLQRLNLVSSSTHTIENHEKSLTLAINEMNNVLEKDQFLSAVYANAAVQENILMIKYGGEKIYLKKQFSEKDIEKLMSDIEEGAVVDRSLANSGILIYYSRENLVKMSALENLSNFFLILVVLFMIVIIYTRHFAQTVTDPIFVMRNGFEQRDYTLAVKIPENYQDDDIFQLANDYNTRWLPAKMRKLNELKNKTSLLSLKDVFGGSGE
ncbi:MAG: ion transporter [Spirochaetes bacterium]|nr:ion transporter [Spirochaetota bacterium]